MFGFTLINLGLGFGLQAVQWVASKLIGRVLSGVFGVLRQKSAWLNLEAVVASLFLQIITSLGGWLTSLAASLAQILPEAVIQTLADVFAGIRSARQNSDTTEELIQFEESEQGSSSSHETLKDVRLRKLRQRQARFQDPVEDPKKKQKNHEKEYVENFLRAFQRAWKVWHFWARVIVIGVLYFFISWMLTATGNYFVRSYKSYDAYSKLSTCTTSKGASLCSAELDLSVQASKNAALTKAVYDGFWNFFVLKAAYRFLTNTVIYLEFADLVTLGGFIGLLVLGWFGVRAWYRLPSAESVVSRKKLS